MCFKKPKAPPKSSEDIALEKELEAQRKLRKQELAAELQDEKKERTEFDVMRSLGLFGFRSLIAGPRGGAGFLSAYGGRVTGASGSSLLARSRKKSTTPSARPIMSSRGGSVSPAAGATGGTARGRRSSDSLLRHR